MGSIRPVSPLLIEPVPAPIIPVSGIGMLNEVSGGLVCVTYYQEIPAYAARDPLDLHVVARLLWPRSALLTAVREFPTMLEGLKPNAEGAVPCLMANGRRH